MPKSSGGRGVYRLFISRGALRRKSSPLASFSDGVAPSAYFAGGFAAGTSQISAFCALTARSPCICSRLQVALGLRPKCPQGTRSFPAQAAAGVRYPCWRKAAESAAHVAGFGIQLGGPASPPNLLTAGAESAARRYAPLRATSRVSCVLWTLETLARSGTGADPHPCRGGSERSHARALETLAPGRKEAAPSPAMGEDAARHCFLNCPFFQPA